MKLFYSDVFVLPLPAGHRFPMEKYARLRHSLLDSGLFAPRDFHLPPAADDATLAHAHDPDYIRRVSSGQLTSAEAKAIGFPWSPEMVERSRRSAGATLAAARTALAEGCAINLAGGTHHAFADRGEGFCVFNDAAVTCLTLLAEGAISRALIVDCDVHQGNGTAAILRHETRAYTFSMHGANNYPFEKEQSDLDVELPDGTGDAVYLQRLDDALPLAFDLARPELVIYLAGADPYEDDKLGRLKLTKAGLLMRDRMVLEECRARRVPVAIAMAGGYARKIEDTVAIHTATVMLARELFQGQPPVSAG